MLCNLVPGMNQNFFRMGEAINRDEDKQICCYRKHHQHHAQRNHYTGKNASPDVQLKFLQQSGRADGAVMEM